MIHDPYWTADEEIGRAVLDGEPYGVRMRVHEDREVYAESHEIVPVAPRGERAYFQARAYVLLPDVRVTVGLREPAGGGGIGEVLSSEYAGVRPLEVGSAQGWYYPAERTLVLWECLVDQRYRERDPLHDEALRVLWEGWERLLVGRSPGARRVVTPSWEPLYERPAWQRFLESLGYGPVAERAFGKQLARPEA